MFNEKHSAQHCGCLTRSAQLCLINNNHCVTGNNESQCWVAYFARCDCLVLERFFNLSRTATLGLIERKLCENSAVQSTQVLGTFNFTKFSVFSYCILPIWLLSSCHSFYHLHYAYDNQCCIRYKFSIQLVGWLFEMYWHSTLTNRKPRNTYKAWKSI